MIETIREQAWLGPRAYIYAYIHRYIHTYIHTFIHRIKISAPPV